MRTPYVSREKVLFMKPVLAPLLPADMASAKVYPERLYGNAKCLCPEGRLCTDYYYPGLYLVPGAYILFLYYLPYRCGYLFLIGGLVKEAVFDLVLSCNSLFFRHNGKAAYKCFLAGMPVKDTTGKDTLCFSVCKK